MMTLNRLNIYIYIYNSNCQFLPLEVLFECCYDLKIFLKLNKKLSNRTCYVMVDGHSLLKDMNTNTSEALKTLTARRTKNKQ